MADGYFASPIKRVAVVDDSDDARATMSDELASAAFEPKPLVGPFGNASSLAEAVKADSDAAVCDHHLSIRNFAACTGAEAVALLYQARFPAVLVTNWIAADFDHIRLFRRGVAVLMTPDDIDPDAIARGFEICQDEFRDKYLPTRKPWRTLVRIEEIDFDTRLPVVQAVVPGWDKGLVIRFPVKLIDERLQQFATPGARFFAKVNTGAEDQAELFFCDFEFET